MIQKRKLTFRVFVRVKLKHMDHLFVEFRQIEIYFLWNIYIQIRFYQIACTVVI